MSKKKKTKRGSKITVKQIMVEGQWVGMNISLIKFMGLHNAVFFIGLADYYNYLSEKYSQVRNGIFWYQANKFTEKWGLSLHEQNKAIEVLSRIGWLRIIGRARCKSKRLQICEQRCKLLMLVLERISEKCNLHTYFDNLQDDRQVRKITKDYWKDLKHLEIKYPVSYTDIEKEDLEILDEFENQLLAWYGKE